ncbi:pyridoxamine 5'-phosphate oxidase family protein [Pseudorhizobium pelagicum]|uniref:Pyridoxamine 5-phosphate oxidase n=1 Tax=Pseudorhizobium pelagicum TaxID=1509405 RepID=A0A922P0G6_9HYPH|nr:pyridoxamine 5'-phosphate oxidase family protein [Pseudorhizobium pelagicum]KEQ02475.1 pyridoxamine 5-phosphate oxidase [Pseudorhizobium pelagicum]KEQ03199.1 pyridoxamine 5-phosphate oxidase [Pseudorhizobium pelagicum]
MPYHFLEIAVTPSVRDAQAEMGVDPIWLGGAGQRSDRFTDNEVAFIGMRDSFYMASVSETGWPYLQHRGGKTGFLKVIDDRTLAFADFRGNRQYISAGNLAANDRACLFLMDYARRARLKIYIHVDRLALDADEALALAVSDPNYKGRVERMFKLRLEAFDWNCPQHITPRFTEREVEQAVLPLRERLSQLESENSSLRARLKEFEI